MSFPYIGTGGLFTRLGQIAGAINSVQTYLGTGNISAGGLLAVGPAIDAIAGTYAAPDTNLINTLYPARDSYRQVHLSYLQSLQNLAQNTVVQMVNDYAPQPTTRLPAALQYLIQRMQLDAQTVTKPTVSASSSPQTGIIGTGSLSIGLINSKGVSKDYLFNETITAKVTTDGQSGGTPGQETFTLTSPSLVAPLAWNYRQGSGIDTTTKAVDAAVDNSSNGANILQNGSFKQWTNPSVGPDNWLILTGTVGTQITQQGGSIPLRGANCLGLVGDGVTLTALTQPFGVSTSTAGNAGGTAATLTPLTSYCLNVWLKASAVPTAGVLQVDLTDGSNNITSDYSDTANSLAIPLTGLSATVYTPYTIFFRTPAVIPANGFRLRLHLTTALSSGSTVYVSAMGLTKPVDIYPGGPQLVFWAGGTNWIMADTYLLSIVNNYSSKWQFFLEQVFSPRTLGLYFPSSAASPTIADSLIT